jgi:hypothetical protein
MIQWEQTKLACPGEEIGADVRGASGEETVEPEETGEIAEVMEEEGEGFTATRQWKHHYSY